MTSAGTSVLPAMSVDELRDLAVERRDAGRRFGRALLQVVHLHRHVEELLALRIGQHDLRVAGDAQGLGLDRLAVDDAARRCRCRRGRIGPGLPPPPPPNPPPPPPPPPPPQPKPNGSDRRSPASLHRSPAVPRPPRAPCAAGGAGIGCTRRSQHAELMPALTAVAGIAISRTLAAGRVGDLQLHVVRLVLHEVGEHGRLRRVLAVEHLVAPELVVAIARRSAEHRRRRRREQLRLGVAAPPRIPGSARRDRAPRSRGRASRARSRCRADG